MKPLGIHIEEEIDIAETLGPGGGDSRNEGESEESEALVQRSEDLHLDQDIAQT